MCHVRYRAVLLAQLLPDDGEISNGRGIALLAEDLRECLGWRQVWFSGQDAAVVALHEGNAAACELDDCVLALGFQQEAQGLGGQVVVLLIETVAPGLGQCEDLRRATSPAAAVDLLLA